MAERTTSSSGSKAVVLVLCLVGLAAGPAAGASEVPLGHADFYPSCERPVGFRGDWTGCYPGAEVPLRWSTRYNVIWKQTVGRGESAPLVVGERVFILVDGIVLHCLDKPSGQLLWKREHHARQEAVDEVWVSKLEEYVGLYHRAAPLLDLAKTTERRLDYLRKKEPDFPAAEDKKMEAVIADCKKQVAEVHALQDKLGLQAALDTQKGKKQNLKDRAITYAIAVPCSDGESIYVMLPTGAVIAYTLDGERQWFTVLPEAGTRGGGWNNAQCGASPLLVDGRIIVDYRDIYCLDAKTGEILWESPHDVFPIASPVAVRSGTETYIGLGSGQIMRLSDGQFVHSPPKGGANVGSPVVVNQAIYWFGTLVDLPTDGNGACKERFKMSREQVKERIYDRGWHGYSCPLWYKGMIFTHAHGQFVSLIDPANGELIAKQEMRSPPEVYPSATLAGTSIILAEKKGLIISLEPATDTTFRVVAKNHVGYLGGNHLVPDGNRLFMHCGDDLYCIGDPLVPPRRSREEAARLEALAGSRTVAELIQDTRDGPVRQRLDAVEALGLVGPRAQAAEQALEELLTASEDPIVFAALRTLLGLSKTPAALVERWAGTLDPTLRPDDPEWRSARTALVGLRGLGPAAGPAAAKAISLLGIRWGKGRKITDSGWKPWVLDLLVAIGPGARKSLADALGARKLPNRFKADLQEALEALEAPDPKAERALPEEHQGPRTPSSAMKSGRTR